MMCTREIECSRRGNLAGLIDRGYITPIPPRKKRTSELVLFYFAYSVEIIYSNWKSRCVKILFSSGQSAIVNNVWFYTNSPFCTKMTYTFLSII